MLADLFTVFESRIARLERIRQRVEKLVLDGRMERHDVEVMYESLFLRSITYFESLLENLFCRILLGKVSYPRARASKRVEFPSASSLYNVVWGSEKYLEWLPYEKTRKRAEKFLSGGRPFSELAGGELSKLKGHYVTRNAIAHSSDHARNEFKKVVIGNQHLPPRERSPAGYLRSVFRLAPRTTRFEQAMDDLRGLAQHLSP